MALKRYGVLKGRVSDLALDDDNSPHIEVRIEAGGASYRIAVNVRSAEVPHDLLYQKVDQFDHAMLSALGALPEGFSDLSGGAVALDYVRGGFVKRASMSIAPFQVHGPKNDLRDFLEPLVHDAIRDPSIHFYAFGEPWGPEVNEPDEYFHFSPGRGIHDIHMNQGSRGRFAETNGVNQDGALLIHHSGTGHWSAVFLAFQSQDWVTDPKTGHPVSELPEPDQDINPLTAPVGIIAALINPSGQEEGRETVTILNRTDTSVDLSGWRLADRTGRAQGLAGILQAGEMQRIRLNAGPDAPRLGNKDGEILLLAADGMVVDRVVYQKKDAAREGWTTVF